jgi:hypothetical protein
MYKGAIITETQKNILQGLMFKDNSFFSPFERGGQWYISEAEVLQNTNIDVSWVNNLVIVDLPPLNFWHEEDKAVQIIQNKSGVVWGAMNEPEIAMGLALHRQAMNMQTHEEGDKLYFYANTILPEHQAIFDAYPQLEITVSHAEN